MKKSIVAIVFLSFAGMVALSLYAQSPPSAQPAGKVADLAWMSGRWTGQMFGQPCEEHWMKPEGKSMIGMFRLGPAGAKPVYEIMLIEEEEAGVMIRLRHFGNKLVAWEKDEPVTLKMSKLAGKEATFEPAGTTDLKRMTYRRESDDKLFIELQFDREGKSSKTTSTLTRVTGD